MRIAQNEGITYHLDEVAEALATQYDPEKITEPQGLTGDFMDECAVYPFLLVALNTRKYWGFDINGYRAVVDFFQSEDRVNMAFARGRVKGDETLAELVRAGHLRSVEVAGKAVYFPSESLVRTSTSN